MSRLLIALVLMGLAAPLAHANAPKIYRVSNKDITNDWNSYAIARCDSGDAVVGGGCEDSGEAGERWSIYTTAPIKDAEGWQCRGKRESTDSRRSLTVTAICMKAEAAK